MDNSVSDTSTRGFERLDPRWHSRVESAPTVDEIVTMMRDYVATLTPEQLGQLPERCRPLRVKAEDDIEYWTFRLSAIPAPERASQQFVQDLFMHFLHASLRIAQIHRSRASRAAAEAFPDGM
jgi:hypothetical protein